MKRDPDGSAGVFGQFDEVIAAAEGSQRQPPVPVVLIRRGPGVGRELFQCLDPRRGGRAQPGIVLAGAHRNAAFDTGADRGGVGNVRALQRRPDRNHAAPDVDADRRRNDGVLGGEHGADGRPLAVVAVGHHGDVPKHERHARRVQDLLLRLRLDGLPGKEDDGFVVDALHGHRPTLHVTLR